MDTQTIEQLASELAIPLPPGIAKARATLDALSVLDVPLQPEESREVMASRIRAMVERGEAVDAVAMVRENRSGADHAEAAATVQRAVENAEILLYQGLQHSPRLLVPVVRARIEALYGEARKLPNGPTTSADAIHGDAATIAAFRALEELAEHHGKLRALHKALIADETDASALRLFSDTRCRPVVAENGRSYVPAGPADKISRLRWLTTSEAQAWVPTAQECTEFYMVTLRQMQAPKPSPAPTAVRA